MKEVLKRFFIKITSSKVIITLAAVVLLYIIVIGKRTEFKEIAIICAGVIPVYCGANVIQHKLEDKKDSLKED